MAAFPIPIRQHTSLSPHTHHHSAVQKSTLQHGVSEVLWKELQTSRHMFCSFVVLLFFIVMPYWWGCLCSHCCCLLPVLRNSFTLYFSVFQRLFLPLSVCCVAPCRQHTGSLRGHFQNARLNLCAQLPPLPRLAQTRGSSTNDGWNLHAGCLSIGERWREGEVEDVEEETEEEEAKRKTEEVFWGRLPASSL